MVMMWGARWKIGVGDDCSLSEAQMVMALVVKGDGDECRCSEGRGGWWEKNGGQSAVYLLTEAAASARGKS